MNLVSELDLPVFDYSAADFPADGYHQQPPQLDGVEGVYGVDKLPVTWSDSSAMSPNHGPAADVS
jgi:hypothetical protein